MSDLISIEALRAGVDITREPCACDGRTPGHSEMGLGHDKCGCYGDSGVLTVPCPVHEDVCADALLALLDVAEARHEINGMIERLDTDYDRLNLLFTRERMALARFDFGGDDETP